MGRYVHGCGHYFNDQMERVFLVAGGAAAGGDSGYELTSTETLIEGGQAWNFQQPLPTARYGLQGISLLDTVIMTGGVDTNSNGNADVLAFVPQFSNWLKIGSMKNTRYYHGASLVKISDVIDFCNE